MAAFIGTQGRMMPNYDFTLTFTLPSPDSDPEQYLDALYEAGCDDALVGIGRTGMIGFDVTRNAASADHALRSAIEDVQKAIPGAVLIKADPDLVGLSDMAETFGFSRQNMRKYATGDGGGREPFPLPVVSGDPSLWHLAEVTAWLKANTAIKPAPEICAVAKATARLNFEIERKRLKRILELA